MQPHQQRVVDEKTELDSKIERLRAFFDTPIYGGLPEAERTRLQTQRIAMSTYSEILGERIAAF